MEEKSRSISPQPGRSFGWLRSPWLAIAIIAAATLLAYSNTLRCPFIFDDTLDIVGNSSIRHLWPPCSVLTARLAGQTYLQSRPVANVSFALDYAVGGLDPLPYHLTNIAIHLLAGLTLFGIVRRTLLLPALHPRFSRAAVPLATMVAVLWAVHPLQTGAVTYLVQRYESLMGLFYLLALYAAIRCGTSAKPGRWAAASVAATLLALGTKEVAVSLPIVILLYDRALLAGSFREAWRRRRGLYSGLIAAWAVFAVIQSYAAPRCWAIHGPNVSPWYEYARTQPGVILHYVRLAFWPRPQVLDYDWPVARSLREVLPGTIVVGCLVLATLYALWRRPAWGLLGAWFFLILAPTSSVMPIADLAFEHRMYLPLAAVVATTVLGGYLLGTALVRAWRLPGRTMAVLAACLVGLIALALDCMTWQRNRDYQSELSIWHDTLVKAPDNARAYNNLAVALLARGQADEAVAHYRKALELRPDYAVACNNLAVALAGRGRSEEAVTHFRRALKLKPDYAEACNNLAVALAGRGQIDEAIARFQEVLELEPDYTEAHNNLAIALAGRGRTEEALAHYRKALEIRPDYANAHYSLASVLAGSGRADEAIAHFRQALELQPDNAEAHYNLAVTLVDRGRLDEAVVHFQKALELKPDFAQARRNLAVVLPAREELRKTLERTQQGKGK